MHVRVGIEALDLCHDVLLADAVLRGSELNEGGLDAGFSCGLEFHLDVGGRVGAGALLEDGEVRLEPGELCLLLCDAGGDALAEGTTRFRIVCAYVAGSQMQRWGIAAWCAGWGKER